MRAALLGSCIIECCSIAMLATSSARAASDSCNDAYVETQRLRRAGHLRSAQQRALVCAQDECSVTVRRDCSAWLEDIVDAMPSVVIEAHDPAGNELLDVKVFSGDQLLAERLDGKALAIDPGAHELRFEYGGQTETLRLVALEGQAYRRVAVRFSAPLTSEEVTTKALPMTAALTAKALPMTAAPAPRELEGTTTDGSSGHDPIAWLEETERPRPIPLASYVFGGVGVASLTSFGILATSAYMTERELRNECGRECDRGSVDSVRERYIMGDVALALGVSSLIAAGAVWMFSSSPGPSGTTAEASALGVELRGSRVTLQGRF